MIQKISDTLLLIGVCLACVVLGAMVAINLIGWPMMWYGVNLTPYRETVEMVIGTVSAVAWSAFVFIVLAMGIKFIRGLIRIFKKGGQ